EGGSVIDEVDSDRHRGRVAVGGAVGHLVGEAVAAVEVGGRHVGERAVVREGELAVRGAVDEGGRQRVAVHIGVVVQDAELDRHGEGRVLGRGVPVRGRHGSIIHRVNGDGDGDLVAEGGAVVRRVGEAVGAV